MLNLRSLLSFASSPIVSAVSYAFLVVTTGFGQATPTTPQSSLPTADQVIARSIEATGGKDAYGKVHSRSTTGKLSIPMQKLSGPVMTHQKSPGVMTMTMTFEGVGDFHQGFDGKVGWEKSDIEGVRLLSGDELERSAQLADPQAELKWKDHYTKATTAGTEDIEGKKCFRVDLVTKGGKNETRYYDATTGLLVRADMEMETPRGNVKVSTLASDWREVDGVKLPFKAVQKINLGGMQLEYHMTTAKVVTNPTLPDEQFKLPADVAEMVKQQSQPATQPGK